MAGNPEVLGLQVGNNRSPTPLRLPAASPLMSAIGASATVKQRFNVSGLSNLRIRTKGAVTGTVTLGAVCVDADAKSGDDSTGTQATTGNPAGAAVANNTEQILDVPLKGEEYVDVTITTAAASSYQAAYVDVFGLALS